MLTLQERNRIADIFNDALIDYNLHIAEERRNFGQSEHQKILVPDDILLEIVLRHWQLDALEVGFSPDWRYELKFKMGDEHFLTISDEDAKPYRVRAGILLESTPQYRERMEEKKKSKTSLQVGSQVAEYVGQLMKETQKAL